MKTPDWLIEKRNHFTDQTGGAASYKSYYRSGFNKCAEILLDGAVFMYSTGNPLKATRKHYPNDNEKYIFTKGRPIRKPCTKHEPIRHKPSSTANGFHPSNFGCKNCGVQLEIQWRPVE